MFVKEDYLNSFFFWLDIVSTLSLVLDIQLISNQIGLGGSQAANTASLARAGRASRVGTKYKPLANPIKIEQAELSD